MTTQSLSAATLSYDAASRLSKTIINGTETQLLYDGTNLVAERIRWGQTRLNP